jgi:GntR family transcriptional regulator of arabinose operon
MTANWYNKEEEKTPGAGNGGGIAMAAKYQILADILREELLKNARTEQYKLPTEAELTRRYRMSRQTVRHTLRLLTEEGLIESRQGSGTYATGKASLPSSRQIAVITSFLDDYIFPTILHDAQSVFAQEGFTTAVYATENQVSKEREILTQLLQKPVSGILVEGSKTALPSPNSDLYRRLRQEEIPLVFLHGAYADLPGTVCVSDDNYGGGYQLARYLIAKGHKNIAGLFKSDDVQGPQRYHGVISAIRDAGLPINDYHFRWYDTNDREELMLRQNTELINRFIQQALSDATAVICYNDEVAFQVIQVLLAMGRRVPEDLAVVSFDNSYYSQIGSVHITSLAHSGKKMGRVAAQQLIRACCGGNGVSSALEWTLIERDSG